MLTIVDNILRHLHSSVFFIPAQLAAGTCITLLVFGFYRRKWKVLIKALDGNLKFRIEMSAVRLFRVDERSIRMCLFSKIVACVLLKNQRAIPGSRITRYKSSVWYSI